METNLTPIWPPHEAFYINSMLFNSTIAIRSILRIQSILERLPRESSIDDIERLPTKPILNELQNIVLQSAAISRYFWPIRKGHELRGDALRKAFSVKESSPLFSRDLRNALEHFDERLDKYLVSGIVGYVLPEYVGPKPADDDIPCHYFRAYYWDYGVFRILDQEFNMVPIITELQLIHNQLITMDEHGAMFRVSKVRNKTR